MQTYYSALQTPFIAGQNLPGSHDRLGRIVGYTASNASRALRIVS